ncbi:MAG: VWA domain-containing protein [Bacteroidetes bacterium]|nr:VWA domain-containing protein [Bacteroidota bacterium]
MNSGYILSLQSIGDVARFQYPWFLNALWILPIFIVLFVVYRVRRKKTLKKLVSEKLQKTVVPDQSKYKPTFKFIAFLLGIFFLIVACANLQFGGKKQEVTRKGIDIMLCLDVSNSMNAQDIQPNRLERAKLYISSLIEQLGSDRIGIIVFAGDAFVQLPLTTDHAAAKMFLNTINTNLMPVQGTAIGRAIELSMESFPKESKRNQAIVVITDGENHEDDADGAIKNAKEKNIKTFTVGMGSEKGSPIPIVQNGQILGYRKDAQGNTITTRLNEQMLFDLAESGGGKYFNAYSPSEDLFKELNSIKKTESESVEYTDYEDHFWGFLLLGFIFIIVAISLPDKKWKWLRKANL